MFDPSRNPALPSWRRAVRGDYLSRDGLAVPACHDVLYRLSCLPRSCSVASFWYITNCTQNNDMTEMTKWRRGARTSCTVQCQLPILNSSGPHNTGRSILTTLFSFSSMISQHSSFKTTEAEGCGCLTQHSILPCLAGGERWGAIICHVMGLRYPPAMTYCTASPACLGAAQLRASGILLIAHKIKTWLKWRNEGGGPALHVQYSVSSLFLIL